MSVLERTASSLIDFAERRLTDISLRVKPGSVNITVSYCVSDS